MRTPALVSIVVALHVLAVGAFVFIQGCESVRAPRTTAVEPPPAPIMPPRVTESTPPSRSVFPPPHQTPSLQPPVEGATHIVAKGESLSAIAARYGISWRELAEYNSIENTNMLKVGQKLIIPPYAKKPAVSASSAPVAAPSTPPPGRVDRTGATTYVVQAGDNLTRIARNHGVKIADLRAANTLQGDMIRVGQKLNIPAAGGAAPAVPTLNDIAGNAQDAGGTTSPIEDIEIETIEIDTAGGGGSAVRTVAPEQGNDLEYIVMDGDTLDTISKLFIVSKQSLIEYNGLRPDRELKVGDVIRIPPSAL